MDRPVALHPRGVEPPATWDRLGPAVGLPLAAYRPAHIARCVERAEARAGVRGEAALARAVEADPELRAQLRRWVAVSHSGLFRDAQQFALLERDVLPALLERRGTALRVWSAGCAAGLELWSLAVVLHRLAALARSSLLGSDLLAENIAVARTGEAARRAGLPAVLGGALAFERRDLTREGAPPGAWDLVLCRNLAIYLEPGAKARLQGLLAGALAPGGVLLLGRTERLPDPGAIGLRPLADRAYVRTADG